MQALQRRTAYLFLAMVLVHVLLISAQVQSKTGLPVLETVAFGGFARVQRMLASIGDGGRSLWSNYFALRGVARENADLRRRVLQLEGELQQAQAAASQTHALEATLGLQKSMSQKTLAARVIAGDPSPGSLTVTIDRGTADGVNRDMAVLAPGGVVGRVINNPLPHAAQVQLIIGRNAAVGVMLERAEATAGIAVGGSAVGGSGDPPLRLQYIPNAADVKIGDRVLTSGQDGVYPRGFAVGTVAAAERRGGDWIVKVKPTVDFSHIDFVLIVLERQPAAAAAGAGGAGS
jgi:rod shape-determining protein MreC